MSLLGLAPTRPIEPIYAGNSSSTIPFPKTDETNGILNLSENSFNSALASWAP